MFVIATFSLDTAPLPELDMGTLMPLVMALLGMGALRTYEKTGAFMSTLKEVEVLLRKVKKENRELKKAIEEKDLHIKFLNERLDNWADKNALLREEKLKITVDDVIAFQKAKAEYASSQNRSLTEQLEKQEKVELDGNLSG